MTIGVRTVGGPTLFSWWLHLHLWWIMDFPQDTKTSRLSDSRSPFHFGTDLSEGAFNRTCPGTEMFSWFHLENCGKGDLWENVKPVLEVSLHRLLSPSSWDQQFIPIYLWGWYVSSFGSSAEDTRTKATHILYLVPFLLFKRKIVFVTIGRADV